MRLARIVALSLAVAFAVTACGSSTTGTTNNKLLAIAHGNLYWSPVAFVDFGIEYLESPLTVDAVLADGSSLARLHRLKKLIKVLAAALLVTSRVDAALTRYRRADASNSDLEDLTARRVDLGGCCCNNK